MKPFVMGLYPMAADETVRFATLQFDLGERVVGHVNAAAAEPVWRESAFESGSYRNSIEDGAPVIALQ